MPRPWSLLTAAALAWAAPCRAADCAAVFASDRSATEAPIELGETERFLAYFGDLLENGYVGDVELARLSAGLASGELVNPIGAERYATAAVVQRQHFAALIGDIDAAGGPNLARAREFVESHQSRRRGEQGRSEVVREETRTVWRKISFVPIRPGKFRMGPRGHSRPVEIQDAFDIADVLVTQAQFALAMDGVKGIQAHPSQHHSGPDEFPIKVRGERRVFQGDNPVEQVSRGRAIRAFLKRLNVLSSSDNPEDQALLRQVVANPRKWDHYFLPFEEQWEYVARAEGTAHGRWHFGGRSALLPQHGWVESNSDDRTHPVAQLTPLMIREQPVYDLYGNVWEITASLWMDNPALATQRGGSYRNEPDYSAGSWFGAFATAERGEPHVGFRIARMPKKRTPH